METNANVLRTHRNKNYKTIGCTALDDKELSFRAKGIHTYLITRPDGWKFNKTQIMSMSTEGRDAFAAAFKELKNKGYIQLTRHIQADGTYLWYWDIYEDLNHILENRTSENPNFGGPVHITYSNITNKDSKEFKDLTNDFNKAVDNMDWLPE